MSLEITHMMVLIQKRNHPLILQRSIQVNKLKLDINLEGDLRDEIKKVLESTRREFSYGLKVRYLNCIVEEVLYMKGFYGLLLM